MDPRLEPVKCQFHVTGGPDSDWHVRSIRLQEELSQPYELVIEVLTEEVDAETDDLLGADAELTLARNAFERQIHGIIEQVDLLGLLDDLLHVRLYVVPAFRLLTQQIDTRIFQDLTAPEILEKLLGESLGSYGRKLDTSRLGDAYLVRDYCVQYGESSFDFANRLMQEEGISYFFESEVTRGKPTGAELMILVDQDTDDPNAAFPLLEGEILDQIPIIADRPETADTESLRYLEWCRPQEVTKVTTRRFNWKRPAPKEEPVAEEGGEDSRGRTREIYAPDDRRRIEDRRGDDSYQGTGVEEDEGPTTIKRLQMFATKRARGVGASNVTCMRPGGRFDLAEHSHPDLAFSRLLATRVVHSYDGTEHIEARYHNTLECIPADVVVRPSDSTPKPRVYGPQTAVVAGPVGEEIHTDAHGRIKVKFHWDRQSEANQDSSCWVRVAQSWAGPSWGTLFLPRIGMEVIVEFLEGNPDRPVVVGCVYNGNNQPPYPLPGEKTKSTIKSNSSTGGDGFNEFRFEDAKGSEEIYLHAQKDHNRVVKNDRSARVGANDTTSIGGERSADVAKDDSVKIAGKQAVKIGTPEPLGGTESDGRTTLITGHDKLDVSETITICAKKYILLQVGGSSVQIDGSSITAMAAGGTQIKIDTEITGSVAWAGAEPNMCVNPTQMFQLGSDGHAELYGTEISLDADAKTKIETPTFYLDGNNVTIEGGEKIIVDGKDVTVEGGGKVVVDGNDVVVEGKKVHVDGNDVLIEGPSLHLDGTETSIEGTTVSISGDAVEIN